MKIIKKTVLILTITLLSLLPFITVMAEEPEVSVSLRIEGAETTLYYDNVVLPAKDGLTALDVVKAADATDEGLTVTVTSSLYGDYISAVNNEAEGQILYDGWMYSVNGKSGTESISACAVSNGDVLVLYYSDAYGAEGFQTPVIEDSKINEGILKFISFDVTYDANYNPVETINPVVAATVIWGYGDKTAEYITDENGEIIIDTAQLTVGEHSVSIEKYSKTTTTSGGKLPLVLRLPADTVVKIENETNQSTPDTHPENDIKDDTSNENHNADSDSPQTGDKTSFVCIFITLVAALACVVVKNKKFA